MIKNPFRILISALLVAWILDTLFWRQSFGISFPIFVGMLLIVGFALAFSELKPAARPSLWILVPIVVLAFVPAIRLEPITRFMAVSMTLVCLMIITHTFRGGRWLSYSFSDYAAMPFRLLAGMITGAPQVYKQGVEDQDQGSDFLKPLRSLLPVIKGLLLALPLLLIFSVLLASADAIFAHRLRDFFQQFNIEKLFEYLFRGFYILVLGYVLTGIYLYALTKSQDERLIGLEKPVAQPFIGWVEACVVLASVNLLFVMFVIIQFQYFFGGGGNIHIDGLTYAQYARRGFAELLMVAFFSLLLFLGLSALTRKDTPLGRKIFSGLGVLLGLLVGVILVSAFQRLLLYEDAFGFTRLRTYPHVFMLWIGFTLAAFILLEVSGPTRASGLMVLFAGLGFALTLALLNVDALIVEKNFERARKGAELDLDYLLTLSVDSTPTLVELFDTPGLPNQLRDQIGALLACQADELLLGSEQDTWRGFHFSKWRAGRMLREMRSELEDYPIVELHGKPAVILEGSKHLCKGRWELD